MFTHPLSGYLQGKNENRLNRILGFVLYGMAVYLDMKPSVQADSTRLSYEIIFHSVFCSTRTSAQR